MSVIETTHKMTYKEQECYDIGFTKGYQKAKSEVRHGEWIDNSYYKMDAKGNEIICADRDYVCCSECKFSLNKLDNCVEEFICCPYCGARMNGGNENEDNA